MSEELKATIRALIEASWNQGNVDVLDQYYTQDLVRHSPPFPDLVGLEALKGFITDVRRAYPDFQMTVHEIILEGDMVATRWTWEGTHTGQGRLVPIPPTGKKVVVGGTTLARNVEGRTVEEWQYQDWLGFLQQLGLAPPLSQGGG